MHLFSGLLALLALSAFTGCYTQLATRGQGSPAPAYAQAGSPAEPDLADSLSGDSSQGTAARPLEADTLVPATGAPTIIMNTYYDHGFSYRGYAGWAWDYPALAFGFYSSRYGHYSRPWWWDHPAYSHRYHPFQGSHRHHGPYGHPSHRPPRPTTPAPPSGPYQSEKRLFNPDPAYVPVRKGSRRSQPATPRQEATASPVYTPPPSQPASFPPAPKPSGQDETTQSGSSSGSSPGSSSGSGSQEARASTSGESGNGGDYPSLRKGKRR